MFGTAKNVPDPMKAPVREGSGGCGEGESGP